MNSDNVFENWCGRTEVARQRIDVFAARALAATLDLERVPTEGEALPAGWHWLYFNPTIRRSLLGEDGHPRRDIPDSFLPPVPLPRRMWAGGRIKYLAELPIGAEAKRTSRVLKIASKEGRAGRLCFVTVEHQTSTDSAGSDRVCIVEEQDIVYREAHTPPLPSGQEQPAPERPAEWRRMLKLDTTMLFRYSALTFNGHRIHYDEEYARDVEGYPKLVVHGPLTATLLQGFAQNCKPGRRIKYFAFKGVSPLFVNEEMELQAWVNEDTPDLLSMRTLDQRRTLVMEATVKLEGV